MELILDKYRNWLQSNGVENRFKQYANDLLDIRNGFLGNYSDIQNINAQKAFNSQEVRYISITYKISGIDIFDISDVLSTLKILKIIDEIFFRQKQSKDFFAYSKKSANHQPRATFRRYVDFLEKNYNKNQMSFQNIKDSPKIDLNRSISSHCLNQILYGPPGTGKTYNTIIKAAEIIENRKMNSYVEALEVFKS